MLLAEAPTGVGKSLAYLLPAVLHARGGAWRVVVATCTRSLQDQLFERDLPALLALHTDRLAVRNLTVEWADDVPAFFTHAIEAESFRELVVDGFRGRQAQPEGSAIRLAGGEDAIVRNSRAAAGTDTFVEATEVTGRTVFTGNDVRAARQPVVPASFAGPGGPGRGRGPGAGNR